MANYVLDSIVQDTTTVRSPSGTSKTNINRVFAIIDDMDEPHRDSLEIELSPDEYETFHKLVRSICRRATPDTL